MCRRSHFLPARPTVPLPHAPPSLVAALCTFTSFSRSHWDFARFFSASSSVYNANNTEGRHCCLDDVVPEHHQDQSVRAARPMSVVTRVIPCPRPSVLFLPSRHLLCLTLITPAFFRLFYCYTVSFPLVFLSLSLSLPLSLPLSLSLTILLFSSLSPPSVSVRLSVLRFFCPTL